MIWLAGLPVIWWVAILLADAIQPGRNLFELMEVLTEKLNHPFQFHYTAPFAACGFFRYHGMTAEQFAWVVIKSELLYPKRLVFKSENLYFSCMEESLRLGEKMMGNGAELLEKKRTKQKKPKKPRGRGDAFD